MYLALFILVLILTPALIAGAVSADIALTASSKLKLHKMKRDGELRAAKVLKLQENIGSVSASINFFSITINILSSTIATILVSELLPNMSSNIHALIVTVILTFCIVTYGEIAPVIYVYSNPEKVALFYANFLWRWYEITHHITNLIERLARKSLRLLKINISKKSNIVDSEELKMAIDLHAGDKQSYEKKMLKSILDINSANVESVMVYKDKIEAISINNSTDKIIDFMINSSYTRLPIYDGDINNIIGVIHTKDLIRMIRSKKEITIQDIRDASKSPYFIPSTTKLLPQMKNFQNGKSHMALVVNEYGDLIGMITLEDILEEFVGEISDEHDPILTGARVTSDGYYIVDAGTSISDIEKIYNIYLPHSSDVLSIGGLVSERLGRMPKVKDEIRVNQFKIKVLDMNKNKIITVRISKN